MQLELLTPDTPAITIEAIMAATKSPTKPQPPKKPVLQPTSKPMTRAALGKSLLELDKLAGSSGGKKGK